MSNYDFKKRKAAGNQSGSKGLDLSGLPAGAPQIEPERERSAIERGEALGFTDRGQGGRRRRPPPPPTESLFVKGPAETVQWFRDFSVDMGHRSYWNTLEYFRAMIEQRGRSEQC